MTIYRETSESLVAILLGLDIQPDDHILAICGSGDQTFAMLNRDAQVLAVDKNPDQIEHTRWRMDQLRNRRYDRFLDDESFLKTVWQTYVHPNGAPQYWLERNRFFLSYSRLETIRKNADKLRLEIHDILDVPDDYGDFNKVYLSNISNPSLSSGFLSHLTVNGLVYHAQSFVFQLNLNCMPDYDRLQEEPVLTALARKHESGWHPVVYKKVR